MDELSRNVGQSRPKAVPSPVVKCNMCGAVLTKLAHGETVSMHRPPDSTKRERLLSCGACGAEQRLVVWV